MAVHTVDEVARQLPDAVIRQGDRIDPLAERLQSAVGALIEAGGPGARAVKDVLNGTWLGHRLHSAISDAPIGAWTTALFLDAIGERRAADRAVELGVGAAIPTALAGVADWQDTGRTERGVGLWHAILNSLGLACYVGSVVARRKQRRGLGVGLSVLGYTFAFGGAYLGGELAYRLGTNVNRTAWDPESDRFQAAAPADALVDGKLVGGEITVDGQRLPVVLLKQGDRIWALSGKCTHMSGPLAEGKLVDGVCVECPWHGSTFDMRDGTVVHGPSSYSQPRYEARVRDGQVEVRPAK